MNPKDMLDAAGKFPFVMVITSTLLRGSFFLAVNVPLALTVCAGSRYQDFMSLLTQAVISNWHRVVTSLGNILVIPAFLLGSLLLGIMLTPLERIIAFAFSFSLARSLKWAMRRRKQEPPTFFLGIEAASPEYIELLGWFLANPEKKMHWEWELYHYYVYWGVFINVAIFGGLSSILLWPDPRVVAYLLLATAVGTFFLIFALLRSLVMGRVHEHYSRQYQRNAQQ